ncbi:MAG: site-specific integrase [Methanomassiliicoccus sp.]|nr:site-specific integrase [Methanomassiliicoccus sp.]
MRRFMASASISPTTHYQYTFWLDRVGKLLNYPTPKVVTLAQLRQLERSYPGAESTKAVPFTVTRAMLIYAGCSAAREWKFHHRVRPKVDGVFLSDVDVATIRQYARASGTITELLFSLGADNGLRMIDMRRLTMDNARELSVYKKSTIVGKGRGGGKPGHLELSRMTEKPLAEYLKLREEWGSRYRDSDRLIVVPSPSGLHPASKQYIAARITALSAASGIHFRTHDLRRTYGHRLHMAGVPIETIARLMRHDTINQSFRSYIGIDADELRKAQDLLG